MGKLRTLEQALRDALNNLYDPITLRNSPLGAWLGLDPTNGSGATLRETIEEAIRALRPTMPCPDTGKGRRYYQILHYRYVQQFTQAAVAQRLGLSPRHLRREQDAAILTLAQYLYDRYDLAQRGLSDPTAPPIDDVSSHKESLDQADWLAGEATMRPTNVSSVLRDCLRLAGRLADRKGVILQQQIENVPPILAPATVVKQIMLNFVTAAIASMSGGHVILMARHSHAEGEQTIADQPVEVTIRAAQPETDLDLSASWAEAEAVSRQLVERLAGHIAVAHNDDGSEQVTIHFRAAERIAVLAIEDNADTLQLWERYVEGSPYRLVGVRDPLEALDVADQVRPEIIVLDVMLPNIDGWELLGRLQYHPTTQSVPVVVCTVHPQQELALSLGAKGFLRKPTTRQAFLAALERQTAERAPASPR
jgi:CheY-like chemotaxis protein